MRGGVETKQLVELFQDAVPQQLVRFGIDLGIIAPRVEQEKVAETCTSAALSVALVDPIVLAAILQ
jgi:hypothetical protein